MFVHQVFLTLTSVEIAAEMARALENDVIPAMRREPGFRDEVSFVAIGGRNAVAISLWYTKSDAEAYHHGRYPELMNLLAPLVKGDPSVDTYEVADHTFGRYASVGPLVGGME